MGKRRKVGSDRKSNPKVRRNDMFSDGIGSSSLVPMNREFIFDEVDDFEDQRDHLALQTAKNMMKRRGPPKEQVLGIDGSSSEDDEYDDDEKEVDSNDDLSEEGQGSEEDEDKLYMEDDIVDKPEFKLPDERAWGNFKHRYFGSNVKDERSKKGKYGQDEELVKLEEETARKLQERMAAELTDLSADDLIPQTDTKEKSMEDAKDLVETDVSSLSRSRKLQLLKRESPEFIPLVEDLKSKCEELRCILSPLLKAVKSGKVPEGPIHQYITTKYRLVLNYISMISMYMLVKCSAKNVQNHPVVGRLAQYRQLLQELEPCDNKLASHLGHLLADVADQEDEEDKEQNTTTTEKSLIIKKEKPRKRKKELKILQKNKVAKLEKELEEAEEKKAKLMALLKEPIVSASKRMKAVKSTDGDLYADLLEASSDEDDEPQEDDVHERHDMDPNEKRAIGYDISKNKGLLPYRRKDQRNPRVRYKKKFQQKLKSRKGQVANIRKEMERYGGEITGIRSHAIKSIKIKS